MRISQRLGLGFGIILLLLIGMTVFISLSLIKIGKIEKTAAIHTANLKTSAELRERSRHWLITVEDMIQRRDVFRVNHHEILETSVKKKIEEIHRTIHDERTIILLNEIVQVFNTINYLDTTVLNDVRMGNNASGTIKIFEEDASKLNQLLATLDEMITVAYKQTVSYSKRIEKNCWLSLYTGAPIAVIFSIIYTYCATRGVTKSYKTIEEQKDFFDTILSSTKDMIFIMDKENKIQYMNKAALKEHGFALGKYCCHAICHQEIPCQQNGIEKTLKGQAQKIERTMNGKVYDSVIVPVVMGNKDISKMEILRDITERKHFQDELERLSITDKLTGLYNRRYFDDILEKEVLRARRLRHDLCLLFIDIDKFKNFNDTYGHAMGDKVLQRLGNLIKKHIRNGIDLPCRYGGEEFTVILPETSACSAITIANRILKGFGNIEFHISSGGEAVQRTISVGIAELGRHNNAKSLLVNADKAMYKAKRQGGNKVCGYEFNVYRNSADVSVM